MSNTHWIPLGDMRAGVLAVAISATVSLSLIVLLSSWIAWLLYRYYSQTPAERIEHETRAIRFLASSHGVLFLSLITGDLLQSIGFSMNYAWVNRGALPSRNYPTSTCTAQAVFIQAGDLGSGFSSLIICINLLAVLVFKMTPSMKWIWGVLGVEWLGVAMMTAAGPLAKRGAKVPFYGTAGGWCWINAPYEQERLYLHYLWVFIVAFLDLLIYSIIAIYLAWHRRDLSQQHVNGQAAKVWRVMMLFPLSYIITILPLSIFRLAFMTHHVLPMQYALGAGCIFTLSGAANSCIYGFTRNIISLHGIADALKRGSGSGSFGKSVNINLPRPSLSFGSSSNGRTTIPLFTSPFATLGSARRKSSATGTLTAGALSGIRIEVEQRRKGSFDSPPLTPLAPRSAGSGRLQTYQLRFDDAGARWREEDGRRMSLDRPFARLARRESADVTEIAEEDQVNLKEVEDEDSTKRGSSGSSSADDLV